MSGPMRFPSRPGSPQVPLGAAAMRTVAVSLVVAALVAGGGCALVSEGDERSFPKPEVVSDDTVCEDWMALDRDVRLAYAMHRLTEMRSNDGLDPVERPPRESQGRLLRTYMENQCRMESMEVAAIWRVAHDQYTRLYDRGVFLD